MTPNEKFQSEVKQNIADLGKDTDLRELSRTWIQQSARHKWSYNFSWLGRPAIQFPNDAWAIQELVWSIKPDLIIETGIAHGGSLMFHASMLSILDMCDAVTSGELFDPRESKRMVLGVDIEIRPHNRVEIERHPLSSRIRMLEGSSIDPAVVRQVENIAQGFNRVMVCLDSNHTHEHVLAELNAYGPLVTPGSFCIVLDTIIEDMPDDMFPERPWGRGNNPKTAVRQWLSSHPEFEVDQTIEDKLQITVAPGGFLRRIT